MAPKVCKSWVWCCALGEYSPWTSFPFSLLIHVFITGLDSDGSHRWLVVRMVMYNNVEVGRCTYYWGDV